jgi:hypothetical protein
MLIEAANTVFSGGRICRKTCLSASKGAVPWQGSNLRSSDSGADVRDSHERGFEPKLSPHFQAAAIGLWKPVETCWTLRI